MAKDKEEIIEDGKAPAGVPLPPEEDTEKIIEDAPKTIKVGDKEYDSPEALAEAYQNLESKIGEQGNELGSLRQANKVLTDQISEAQKAAKEAAKKGEEPPANAYEARLQAIYEKLNEGDITVEDALQESNAITAEVAAQKAIDQATVKFQETLTQRDAEAVQKKFLKDHPDFEQLRDTGKLEPIKEASGGMHDDFSAYYEYKAQEAYEKGKADAAKLAEGDEGTKQVLTKPGSTIKETKKPTKPLSETEIEESMLTALEGE